MKNIMQMFSFRSLHINKKFIILIKLLISFSFAIIVLYPNLSAKWSRSDDHEIIAFMGKDHQLSFKEIPSMLMKTEAGFTGVPRYRPMYYLLKLTETATWGNNPLPWYAFRLALFGASIFISWLLLGRFLGVIAGWLVCLIILSHSFWHGHFLTFLGPAEHYCMIGLALYCLAFVNLLEQETSQANNTWWSILAFGAIVCMGSKENFLLLLPVTAILVYHAWNKDQLNKISIFTNSLLFIFGLFVTIAVIIVLKKNHGFDLYSNPVDPIIRFKVLLTGFFFLSHLEIQLPFLISIFLILIASLFHKLQQNKTSEVILKQIKRLFLAEAACVLVWCSQFIFYNGMWPDGTRYDFPGVLAQDMASVFLLFSPLTILKKLSSDFDLRRAIKVVHALLIISLSIFIIRYGIGNYKKIYQASIIHRNDTQNYEQMIFNVMQRAKVNPSAPIIFNCTNIYNIEAVFSALEFLTAYNIKNPIVLSLKDLSELTCRTAVDFSLLRKLKKWSNGEEVQSYSLKVRFCSAQSLPQTIKQCFIIDF